MTGANSAVGLRSMSARFLFLDEIDAYPGDVEGEGDPVALAEARARTFGRRRKALLVSTPTITARRGSSGSTSPLISSGTVGRHLPAGRKRHLRPIHLHAVGGR